jgi:protein TonB
VSNLAAPKHQEELNMFDKLVESTSTGAELKPRRRIFAASFVLVAVLFAAAVVTSIYAADFDLGNDNFDIAQLLSPIAETEPPREPEPQQQRQTSQASSSDRPTRVVNQLRIDELPTTVPPISTQRNTYLSRPQGEFDLGRRDTYGTPVETSTTGVPEGSTTSNTPSRVSEPDAEAVAVKPPPPPVKSIPPVSGGVMTGKAKLLPTPTYSAAARAVNAQGRVTVQITVDEFGKVISARAVDGHPLLKPAAVEAAWKARFDPTKLSGVPVKVTGIISYNFTR